MCASMHQASGPLFIKGLRKETFRNNLLSLANQLAGAPRGGGLQGERRVALGISSNGFSKDSQVIDPVWRPERIHKLHNICCCLL